MKLKILYFRKFVQVKYLGCPECPAGEISIDEQYDLMRMIDSISNYTRYLISLNGATIELKLILQWIRNLNTAFSYVDYSGIWEVSKTVFPYRNRDSQMAENINWIIENFPEEKFTVWCANFHGAKDISQTRYPTDSLLYFAFQSMGETVCSLHGDKIYSLAFTSLDPSPEKRGNLETEISETTGNAPYAFINFEPLRFADGYRDKEFESNVIMKKRGKWLYIFDGLYYIRDQEREIFSNPK
ncbi:hypothetical protein FACS1894174_10120 [Bacteroidia bacterium]|nr:hypothetical protein FACS1894174_10120 [Bacteroidia bacterium]